MKKRKILLKLLIVLVIVLLVVGIVIYYLHNTKKYEKDLIVATKNINNEYEYKEIKYIIEIKDYIILKIQKEIIFGNKEEAQLEYDRYQIINSYEGKNLDVQIKDKKVLILMTESQFKEDIEYDEKNDITLITPTGEQREIINQKEIINCLQQQGYLIK